MIVLLMPGQDQVNYLPYGMIQSSGLSNGLFTMRVSLRIQPVAGQPGMRFELAYSHDLIFLARFRNEPGRRPFTICQDENVEKHPLPTKEVDGGFSCVEGKPLRQIHAIFAKWLRENPEQWDKSVSELLDSSLDKLCD